LRRSSGKRSGCVWTTPTSDERENSSISSGDTGRNAASTSPARSAVKVADGSAMIGITSSRTTGAPAKYSGLASKR
jgi:hypothetical protein